MKPTRLAPIIENTSKGDKMCKHEKKCMICLQQEIIRLLGLLVDIESGSQKEIIALRNAKVGVVMVGTPNTLDNSLPVHGKETATTTVPDVREQKGPES